MGTIQNSINGMLGTAAAAAAAGKHIKNQSEATELAKDNAAIHAAENIEETVDTAKQLGADYDEHKELQDSFKADAEKYSNQLDDLIKNGSPESRLMEATFGKEAGEEMLNKQKGNAFKEMTNAKYNVEMLQKSLDKLALERDAKRLQAEIYQKQINAVGKKGKNMGTYNLPWKETK